MWLCLFIRDLGSLYMQKWEFVMYNLKTIVKWMSLSLILFEKSIFYVL